MGIAQRIRLKEREAIQAREALGESVELFQQVLHERLASRSAMAAGFAAGLWLGWRRRSRRRQPEALHSKTKASGTSTLPRNWLGSYFVWPFLLATARDLVLSRRPSRREA